MGIKPSVLALIFLALSIIPSLAVGPSQRLEKAEFWINRLDSPDSVVLTPEDINALNESILGKSGQMAVVGRMPGEIPREVLFSYLLYDPIPYEATSGKRYDPKGREVEDAFFNRLLRDINLTSIAESNPVEFGVVVERADIRAFPTDEAVHIRPGTKGFDSFQYSSAYPGDEVAVLHRSSDGLWGFVQTSTVRGWMRLGKIAPVERGLLRPEAERFLVVTGNRVPVYGDAGLEKVLTTAPMGTVLYLKEEPPSGPFIVWRPAVTEEGFKWSEGFVERSADVSNGFLPYTRANVIRQAFKMLGEEYGWGGVDGKRDCSEFIRSVFLTMGIRLPRHSSHQGEAGVTLAVAGPGSKDDIRNALAGADPGVTLFVLDGHIMLYLGSHSGEPYVIHQVFGYTESGRFRVVNRVAVTGLGGPALQKESSLFQRIKTVTGLKVRPRAHYEGG